MRALLREGFDDGRTDAGAAAGDEDALALEAGEVRQLYVLGVLLMVSAAGARARRGTGIIDGKRSVRVLGHGRAAFADQEVEVAAFVGLQHAFDVQDW
jgi:hypothetical protein